MLSPNKQRALQALLTQPTKAEAAQAAGITTRALRNYLQDAEFQREYKRAVSDVIDSATRQAQRALAPALSALLAIVEDDEAMQMPGIGNRVSAARSLLDYGLRLTEFNDILRELNGDGE